MPHNPDLPNNHISRVSSIESEEKINRRFLLLERCIKRDIDITDELLELVETDKNLLAFNGNIADFELKPVSRNTVNSHGKLQSLQAARIRARKALTEQPATENNQAQNPPKKETKTSLRADKERLNIENHQLTSELASLRSAYRELLREVSAKLPFDEKIKKIVEVHNKSSVIRNAGLLRVVK